MESTVARVLADAASRAAAYLDGLDARAVAPSPDALAALDAFGGPLPDGGEDPATVLARLDEVGSPATMANAGRRFFGFVVGGALPAAVGASVLATAWDQNVGLYQLAPGASHLEHRSRSHGSSTCSDCRRRRAARSSPAARWRTSRHSSPRATRCLRVRAGTRAPTG
jgi:hypothetical protein